MAAARLPVQARIGGGASGTDPGDAAFIMPAGFRMTLGTFLRVPIGTNQLSTQAAAYLYPTGEVAISHNIAAGGYVSFNEQWSTR